MAVIEEQQEPFAIFLYALKAPETKRQYPRRFKVFLDFLRLEGTFEEQTKQFLMKARTNPQWAQDNLIQFIAIKTKELTKVKNIILQRSAARIKLYLKPIPKLSSCRQ